MKLKVDDLPKSRSQAPASRDPMDSPWLMVMLGSSGSGPRVGDVCMCVHTAKMQS